MNAVCFFIFICWFLISIWKLLRRFHYKYFPWIDMDEKSIIIVWLSAIFCHFGLLLYVSDKSKKYLSLSSLFLLIHQLMWMTGIFLKSLIKYSSWSYWSPVFDFWDHIFGQVGNTALCLKKKTRKMKGICVK